MSKWRWSNVAIVRVRDCAASTTTDASATPVAWSRYLAMTSRAR
jgi:hypothetical protein